MATKRQYASIYYRKSETSSVSVNLHPDEVLEHGSMGWNTGAGCKHTNCVFFGSAEYEGFAVYVGSGTPDEAAVSVPSGTLAGAVIGGYCGTKGVSAYGGVCPNAFTVTGKDFWQYSKSATTNNPFLGRVTLNIASGYSDSVSWNTYPNGVNPSQPGFYSINTAADYGIVYGSKASFVGIWIGGVKYKYPSLLPYESDYSATYVFGKIFALKFNANGGSGTEISRKTYYYGIEDYEPQGKIPANTFSLTDYEFKCWNTVQTPTVQNPGIEISDEENAVSVFESLGLSGNEIVTLYAQWKVSRNLVIHYDANGGSQVISDTTIAPGSSGNVATLSDDAQYRPANKKKNTATPWKDGNGTVYADGQAISNESREGGEITLYAQWVTWQSKTITYSANCETYTGTTGPQTLAAGAGSTAVLANGFSRSDHYVFAGWYDAASGGNAVSVVSNVDGLGTPLTLYAHWYAPTVVTYSAGEGTGTRSNTVIEHGATGNFPSCTFTPPTKKRFLGWYDASSGMTYTEGRLIPWSDGATHAVTAAYEWWDTMTVTFNGNGGSGSKSSVTISPGDTLPCPDNESGDFSRTNHQFSWWNTRSDGNGVTYTPNVSVISNADKKGTDLTLYAIWYTPITVSYDKNNDGATGTMPDTVVPSGSNGTVSACGFVAPTYKAFDCWLNGSTQVAEGATIYNTGSYRQTTSHDYTLKAKWKDDYTCRVVIKTHDGSTLVNQSVSSGESYTIPAFGSFTRTGYTHTGYSESQGGSQSQYYTEGTVISNDGSRSDTVTLFLIWTPKTYTVYLSKNSESAIAGQTSVSVTYGSSYSVASLPSWTGYNFTGFYDQTSGGTKYVDASGNSMFDWSLDQTGKALYAQWSIKTHRVSITRSNSSFQCTMIAYRGSSEVSRSSGATLSFTAEYGTNYTIKVLFATSFLARRYVPSTVRNSTFTKIDDTSYAAVINSGTSDQSMTAVFTTTPIYSITTSSEFSPRITNPVSPTILITPSADGEGKWFAQTVVSSQSGADSRSSFSRWSARNASTHIEYAGGSTANFSFDISVNTELVATFLPKEVEVSCALHSASSVVGQNPECVVTDAYVSGEAHAGDTVRFTAKIVNGYTFKDWVDSNGNVISTERVYTCVLSGDLALYARYGVNVTLLVLPDTSETGTVTLNGQSSSSSVTLNLTLGSTATIGCDSSNFFNGWYSDSQHTEQGLQQYDKNDSFIVSGSRNLYAYIVGTASYNYVAFYNYNQTSGIESYDYRIGTWTINGGQSSIGVDEITKSQYQSTTGLTALSDGVFLRVVGVRRINVTANRASGSQYGFYNVKEYKAANTLGTAIATFSTGSFTFVANQNLILRANYGTRASVTVTIGYYGGSSGNGTAYANGSSSATVQQGDDCVLTAMPRNGYKFSGWYSSADGETPFSTDINHVLTVEFAQTVYARFERDRNAICEWEGAQSNKVMRWTSKTYVSSRPFAPTSVRIDALGYVPSNAIKLTVGMHSSPDALPSETVDLANVDSQEMRRLPKMRSEKYMRVSIENDAEVDCIVLGTSAMGVIA